MGLAAGSTGDDVRKLQGGLTLLGFPAGAADGDFGRSTENAVAAFQKKQKLFVDGKAGTLTIGAYNAALAPLGASGQPYVIQTVTTPAPATPGTPVPAPTGLLKWVKSKADKVPGSAGYTSMVLREDIAVDYQKLLGAVHALGGALTSAGGRRDLESESGPNRSTKSLHYLGRAFDMSLDTGMVDPEKDQFIIERPTPDARYWRVWCRSTLSTEVLAGFAIPTGVARGTFTKAGWYMNSGKDVKGKSFKQPATKTVSFTGFDFTALASMFGFTPIPARPGFFKGDVLAAEWWHHESKKGLKPSDTFGSELLRVYDLAAAQSFVYWETVKDARYGADW
jgi:hypothetical protein